MLEKVKEGAEIHRQVRSYIREWIQPGMKFTDICQRIEDKIRELTGFDEKDPLKRGIAFPTGVSVNNCAAHWTPNPGDNTVLEYDDVCKIDFGVHIDGWIIDSAFTYTSNPKFDPLLEIAKEATYTGIKAAGSDAILGEIGSDIQEVIEAAEIELDGKTYPLKSIGDICGHQIDRFKIHAGKAVPNIKFEEYTERMLPGEFYAIETFPSTGEGHVKPGPDCSHYMLNYKEGYKDKFLAKNEKKLLETIEKDRGTLAFCLRWLENKKKTKFLRKLIKSNVVVSYPPLYDIRGSYVAQFEHTIHIGENKVEILSKGEDY